MPAVGKQTLFISGTLNWAKVVGDPVPNYNKDGREWTFELEPDDAGLVALTKAGLEDRIKGKGYMIGMKGQFADRIPFIQLKKPEFNREGDPNKPIRIYNVDDDAWGDDKIGNGSKGDVKLDVRDYGPGKKSGVYPVAIRVTEHVEFTSSEFGGMPERDFGGAPKAKAKTQKKDTFKEDFNLNDDVPF